LTRLFVFVAINVNMFQLFLFDRIITIIPSILKHFIFFRLLIRDLLNIIDLSDKVTSCELILIKKRHPVTEVFNVFVLNHLLKYRLYKLGFLPLNVFFQDQKHSVRTLLASEIYLRYNELFNHLFDPAVFRFELEMFSLHMIMEHIYFFVFLK